MFFFFLCFFFSLFFLIICLSLSQIPALGLLFSWSEINTAAVKRLERHDSGCDVIFKNLLVQWEFITHFVPNLLSVSPQNGIFLSFHFTSLHFDTRHTKVVKSNLLIVYTKCHISKRISVNKQGIIPYRNTMALIY